MSYGLQELAAEIISDIYKPGTEVTPVFTRTDPQHGDLTTNVALQLAKITGKPPREIAETIGSELEKRGGFDAEVAGPGFINIRLKDQDVYAAAMGSTNIPRQLDGQVIVAEYSDPNPFKVLHAGHLYTSLVGDAIANIFQTAGALVHRVNFGGDVGLHVAKTMWAIMEELGGENPEKLDAISGRDKLQWVSAKYVHGNSAYENDEEAIKAILRINKRIYALHDTEDRESGIAKIYWTCRQWSYDGFDALYGRLGMEAFEKYYPESSTAGPGIEAVRTGLEKGIFQESDGAIILSEEKSGLHTRVFLNSEGLPTYEAKDLGLALTKWEDYRYDRSLIITDKSQQDYMKVVMVAADEFIPEAAGRTRHLTHGQLKLAGGMKMSSRKGNILTADDILHAAYGAVGAHVPETSRDEVVLGAVRYSFLRIRIGGDIVYDPQESVSMDGNSGPYLQYALVRARSILRKIGDVEAAQDTDSLDPAERNLARLIGMYPEVFVACVESYSPHHLCNYLYELAVGFNRFYENSRVIGHERSGVRASLVKAYEATLDQGLAVLGMPRPESM